MNPIQLVAVFAENKPGQTARFTKILAEAGINIRCVTVASIGAFGVIKFLVSEPDAARQALKQHGIAATLVDVIALDMPDKPGALHSVADCLARNNINIDSTSGFLSNNRAVLVVEVPNVPDATRVLQADNFHILTRQDMLAI